MQTRYIVFCFGTDVLVLNDLSALPNVEIYSISGDCDVQDQIDMALMNDLESPLSLVFVGGDDAKRHADRSESAWVRESEAVQDDVLRSWGLPATPVEALST